MSSFDAVELRRRRRALGLTQAALAERLAVTANTVARWERGELHVGRPEQVARVLARLERAQRPVARESGSRTARASTSRTPRASLRAVRHNLPAELSSFVGRKSEIEALVKRLASTRLLTLVGPGGVGKTRLALQVAACALDSYADGVWLVELGRVTDGRMVPSAVATVLHIRERGGATLLTTLAELLRDQNLLLVLDNCEHVLENCAELTHDLLAACPRLAILATSREPLRVSGEVRWPVPPLEQAVQLFVERGRAVQPDFALTLDNEAALTEICARLDRLPLAIELAAARIGSLPPQTLLQQLDSQAGGLAFLTGGPRDAPARQRTLHAAISWSYDLLEPDERTLFRRLAPLRGATLDAVAGVCIRPAEGDRASSMELPPLTMDARAGLASLVDKNLLHVQTDDQGQAWFVMLETVRDFALERLQSSPESEAVWRRFAWYYLRRAELSDGREAHRQDILLNAMEREHGNFRAALDWCQAHGYAEASLRLAVSLLWFWVVRGHLAEGRRRLESLLARFPLRVDTVSRVIAHARALDALARIAAMQTDLATAEDFEQRSLDLFVRVEDSEGVATALEGLGVIAHLRGNLDEARARFERSVAAVRTLAGKRSDRATRLMLGHALGSLAQVAHEQGDDEGALADLTESIRQVEANGDMVSAWATWLYLARVRRDRGELELAREHAETALKLLEGDADRRGLSLTVAELGSIAIVERQFVGAYAHLRRSLEINVEMGEGGGIAFVLDRLAVLASAQGQHLSAFRLAGAAARLREQAGAPPTPLDQQEIDRQLESSRRALGPRTQTALEEGRKLGLSDVLAVANGLSRASDHAPTSLRTMLSAREREVAGLVASGRTNRQIAAQLVVAEGTVATHVQHILAKLELQSRAQIAVWAVHQAIGEDPISQ
jgi:predicted ATPase/DNA-binding CsgD family transcriptional regulator/transcriptional regulator with XRE-family HTH domain